MLFHLCLVALSLCRIEARSDWVHHIESPRITNKGDWGFWDYCPEKSWASAVELKIEDSQGGFGDNTALNAIELTCTALTGDVVGRIRSNEGQWGTKTGVNNCTSGFMTGFELRSEPNQRGSDDAGAVDLKFVCGNGQRTVAGGIIQWGQWTGERICQQQTAVCGISTQVEKGQFWGDDTALNNVGFHCCTVPHPADTCVPTSVWNTLMSCHADCKINFKSGTATVTENLTSQGWRTTQYIKNGFDMSVAYGLGALSARAEASQASTEWGKDKVTNKQISTLITENVYTEVEWAFSISCVGQAQELYIVCGPYEISTKEYRCVPDAV